MWINGKSVADNAPPAERGLGSSADHGDTPGHMRSVIGAFTDVTHWRELEQQQIASLTAIADVQERRAADVDANRREQERFVDVVCHEIRNPLNGIVNNVEQIRAQRQVLRPKLVAALAADPGNALLQSILEREDEEAGMLDAIDLCTSHQVSCHASINWKFRVTGGGLDPRPGQCAVSCERPRTYPPRPAPYMRAVDYNSADCRPCGRSIRPRPL